MFKPHKKLKKSMTILLMTIFIFSFFTGIKVKAIITVTGNNSLETAFEVPSFPFSAITTKEDGGDAYFKLIIDKDTSLKIETTNSNNETKFMNLYKYDESNEEVVGIPYKHDVINYKFTKGIYYIKYSAKNNYKIEINEIEDNYNENNDTWDRATDVVFNEKMHFKISTYNDYDWYKVNIKERGTLKISKERGTDLSYEIHEKSDVLNKIYQGGCIDGAVGFLVEPGIYYVKTYQLDDGRRIPYESELFFEFYKDDKYEDNDTITKATLLEINKDIEINLQRKSDYDWFYINAGETGATLRLQVIPKDIENNMHMSYSVYNNKALEDTSITASFSRKYDYYSDNSVGTKFFCKLQPGINYIKFSTTSIGAINDKANNDVILNAELINDEYENNDTIDKASDIILDKPMAITLDQHIDEDWFKINLKEPGVLKLNLNCDERYIDIYYKTEDMKEESHFCKVSEGNKNKYIYLNKGTTYFKFSTSVHENTAILNWSFIPTNMEYNGTIDTAYPIELGKQIEFMSGIGDTAIQYFKLDVDEDNTKVEPNYYGIGCRYGVLKDGSVSWSDFSSGSTYTLNKGTYYFEVKGNSNLIDNKVIFLIDENSTAKVPEVSMPSGSANNTNNISTMPTLKFKFSDDINVDTLNSDNIKIYDGKEVVPIDYVYSNESRELTIRPTSDLKNDTKYKVVLSYNIRSANSGYKMNHSYEYSFTTEAKSIPEVGSGIINIKIDMPQFNDCTLDTLISARVKIKGEDYLAYKTINDIKNLQLELKEGEYEIQVDVPMMLSDKKTVVIKDGVPINLVLTPTIGDVNGDGIVDIQDISKVAMHYNEKSKVIGE